jgi:hypothetical protein
MENTTAEDAEGRRGPYSFQPNAQSLTSTADFADFPSPAFGRNQCASRQAAKSAKKSETRSVFSPWRSLRLCARYKFFGFQ